MEVRPYQAKAIVSTLNDIRSKSYKSTVLVLPTGGGKTFTAVRILKGLIDIDMLPNDVIVWLVHRKELADQAYARLEAEGIPTGRWDTTDKTFGRVIVAMVRSSKTLANDLDSRGHNCKYLVIDEAHHRAAASYKQRESELKPEFTLCLTATPIRMDDLDLEFDKVSYEVPFLELVRQGYLAKPEYVSYKTGLGFKLRSAGDDFATEDLQALNNERRNDIIAKDYGKHKDEYGKSIVFCVDVEHAYALQKSFLAHVPGTITGIITGSMVQSDREQLLKDFSRGIVDVLFNIQVLTEGYDEPSVKSILLARPTRSEVLWAQMVGRGSRVHPSKPHFNIVDYVDGENNYGMMAEDWAVRLLGVEESPESKERKENALSAELFKDWIKDVGFSGKIPKEKREVLKIDGILTVSTKQGQRRFLVRKQHRARLDALANYVSKNPPARGEDIKNYIDKYANTQNKALLRWPGQRHLLTLAWGLYYRFVLNRNGAGGKPTWVYNPVPDFSVVKEETHEAAICTA